MEAINDINSALVNFYRIVRFHPEELSRELDLALHSREEFQNYIKQPGLTDVQRAARWYYRNKESFGGAMDSFGISPVSGPSSLYKRLDNIRMLNARLDRVYIENLQWKKFIGLYDRENTFFFIDPPYVGCSSTCYDAWPLESVVELRETLQEIKGRWLLTINDSPEMRDIFEGCKLTPIERANGINNRTRQNATYRELIIAPAE